MGLVPALAGCNNLAQLSEVGRPPRMTSISDPTLAPSYRPVTMPMPPGREPPQEAASLWRSGSKAFFKDQRASQVGDLVTIEVEISDTATLNNNTTADRSSDQTFGIPSMFGLKNKHITGSSDSLSTASADDTGTTGKISRNETITVTLAGTITQVLPNGNFVVIARQEVRVNSELREMIVTGVIRPQDITADNTVTHEKMAEARISYGGRGTLTNMQTPRYGQQILDSVLPF